MILTNENYFSKEADRHYMSVSQFKSFAKCEAAALHKLNSGKEEKSKALIVGSYTHAAFESDEVFNEFIKANDSVIFNRKGDKYADFAKADEMINTVKNDEFCMLAMTGEKEVIFKGTLHGVEWKIKVDNINYQQGYFSDLKTTQDLQKRFYTKKYNGWGSFIHEYDYILQMYIYREIIKQKTGHYFNPYIVAVTKQDPPDKAVIGFNPERFEFEKEYVEAKIGKVLEVKNGLREPERCENCDYCRKTKKLKGFIELGDLLK